jgi:hypothetical protein
MQATSDRAGVLSNEHPYRDSRHRRVPEFRGRALSVILNSHSHPLKGRLPGEPSILIGAFLTRINGALFLWK